MLQSGPPRLAPYTLLAADWLAISIAAALETTRHAQGAVRQARGDKLRCCSTAACSGVGGGSDDCNDKDWTDTDRDNAGSNNGNPDYRDRRPP